jgi:uncharacterized protein (TIGR04255 family)
MVTKQTDIKIDEVFETFPKAPIAEAVINVRARAIKPLEETTLRSSLQAKLAGYDFLDSQRQIQHEVKLEQGKPPSQVVQDLGCSI